MATQSVQEKKPQIILKLAVIGQSSSGKTALVERFTENKFTGLTTETIGLQTAQKNVSLKNASARLDIIDLGGSDPYADLYDLKKVSAFIICFDLMSEGSRFVAVRLHSLVKKRNNKCRAVLSGLKYDLYETQSKVQKQIIAKSARDTARKLKCPLIFSSSATGENVKTLFKLAMGAALKQYPKVKQCFDECTGPLLQLNCEVE